VPFTFKAQVLLKDRSLAVLIPTYPYMEGTAEAVTPWESGSPIYAIMVCQSCKKRFVAQEIADGWSAVYPIQHKPVATDIPDPICSEFGEANLCFAIGAYKACVAMCMVVLESLWQQQNASGLNELKDKGTISQRLFDQATEIRLWAGIVKHKLTHETVTKEETEELLTYLEEILDDVYVRPARSAALAKKRKQIEKGDKSQASPSASQ
jgi:hypothetical protein